MPAPKASMPGSVVKSVDRALDVLELIGSAPYQLTFTQIAVELGVPKGSLSHLLSNLVHRGYVDLDRETSKYGLGGNLHGLASRAEAGLSPRQILHDGLVELRDRFNETVALCERRGDEIEIVDRVATQHPLQYTLAVGDRAPLYAHTAGKIVLGFMTDDEMKDYFDRVRFERLAANTQLTRSALRKSARTARSSGIVFGSEELASGVCGYSVPVVVAGALAGIVNVVMPLIRYDRKVATEIEWHLPRVARRMSLAIERAGKAS